MSAKKKIGSRKTNLLTQAADFQADNKQLFAAMQLFEVSNAEYERAMQALVTPTAITSDTSTPEAIETL